MAILYTCQRFDTINKSRCVTLETDERLMTISWERLQNTNATDTRILLVSNGSHIEQDGNGTQCCTANQSHPIELKIN